MEETESFFPTSAKQKYRHEISKSADKWKELFSCANPTSKKFSRFLFCWLSIAEDKFSAVKKWRMEMAFGQASFKPIENEKERTNISYLTIFSLFGSRSDHRATFIFLSFSPAAI